MFNGNNDIYFLISGKVLFIASEFESELKTIAALLEIKRDPTIVIDSESIKEFSNKFLKFKPPHERVKNLILNKDLEQIFKDAISARNYVAHEMTLGLEGYRSDEFSVQEFIRNEVLQTVTDILNASYILKWVGDKINKEGSLNINWIDERVHWVTNIEEY